MNLYEQVTQTHPPACRGETGARAYRPGRNLPIAPVLPIQSKRHDFEQYENHIAEAQETSLTEIVQREFVFRDATAVDSFLFDHRTVPQLLVESLPQLKTYFGADTVFSLKVSTEDDGSRELFVSACWPGNASMAMEATMGFIENWWIERAGRRGARVNFTYELV